MDHVNWSQLDGHLLFQIAGQICLLITAAVVHEGWLQLHHEDRRLLNIMTIQDPTTVAHAFAGKT